MNHELIGRLEQLAARLASTTEHHGYAHMVIEAVEELRGCVEDHVPNDAELERQTDQMREALLQDGSTAKAARRLADEIEREGVERVVYGKSHAELIELNLAIVFALREYALIGIGQRIMDSADAQYFRWLLKHHSGSEVLGGASRCWIGGVEFGGEDVRDAIDAAIALDSK